MHVNLAAVIPNASARVRDLLPDECWPCGNSVNSAAVGTKSFANENAVDNKTGQLAAPGSCSLCKTKPASAATKGVLARLANENTKTMPSHRRFSISDEPVAPVRDVATDIRNHVQPQPTAAHQHSIQPPHSDTALLAPVHNMLQLLPHDLALLIQERLASPSSSR